MKNEQGSGPYLEEEQTPVKRTVDKKSDATRNETATTKHCPKKKSVKKTTTKSTSSAVAITYCKQVANGKRSILGKTYSASVAVGDRAKTLLDQPLPTYLELKPWKLSDDLTKLSAAAVPLYFMARERSWELKTLTLILNAELSTRLDAGDSDALEYVKDEIARRIKKKIPGTEFLYALEKAPAKLSDPISRRRWHLHGLIIGPVGFSSPGRHNPIRKALASLKGEADSDLMFKSPGAKHTSAQSGALKWTIYASKNALTVELAPDTAPEYVLPPGKSTYISTELRREAKRWHDGSLKGKTARELIGSSKNAMYGPAAALSEELKLLSMTDSKNQTSTLERAHKSSEAEQLDDQWELITLIENNPELEQLIAELV